MKNRMRTARVFTLGFIGEAEVTEGKGDCLALGVGSSGETVAVVERHGCDELEMLRVEMERNPRGFVSVITLTGQAIADKSELSAIAALAGRQVDLALRGICAVRYLDGEENRVEVRTNGRGQRRVTTESRFERVVSRDFYCVSCRNAGEKDCRRTVDAAGMEEVEVGGRSMTVACCPKCGSIMTRAGGIEVRREKHRGLAERRLFFEPPARAHCFSCKLSVSMIWVKAVRRTDSQPRPSYRGNCVRCLAMVGTPWRRTRLVAVKTRTLEKLVGGAKRAEDALYERRMAVAEARRREDAEAKARREAQRFRDAMTRLRRQYKVA